MMKAQTAVEIIEVLANRRSPRSLDATAVLSKDDLLAVLEAARWAASALMGNHGDFMSANAGMKCLLKYLIHLLLLIKVGHIAHLL